MRRGRKKGVKPPLTSAERQKRYRARQKEIDPEGYKQKKKKDNRYQYEKNKKNPIKKLQLQMDGITAYYRKNPLVKVINVKKVPIRVGVWSSLVYLLETNLLQFNQAKQKYAFYLN